MNKVMQLMNQLTDLIFCKFHLYTEDAANLKVGELHASVGFHEFLGYAASLNIQYFVAMTIQAVFHCLLR